eukprot:g2600.t1 g2600   contig12:434637-435266(+)
MAFVRRRIRVLGPSAAATAHVSDLDELLRLIDRRITTGGSSVEPIDEQEGLLSAYEQMKKYCLHVTNELTKHHSADENEPPDSIAMTAGLGKAALAKIGDVGNALHLLGSSCGGYGFFEEEMEYYKKALKLKELSVSGKIENSVSASDTLHCMGFSLDNAGRSDEALDCYNQALEIRLECLGDNDLRVAETLHNKGALLCETEQSDEAM